MVIRLERGTKLLVYGPTDATATSSSCVLLKFRPIYLCVANLRRFHGKEFVKRTSVLKACSRCRDRNELNGNTYRSICELPVPFSSFSSIFSGSDVSGLKDSLHHVLSVFNTDNFNMRYPPCWVSYYPTNAGG